MGTYEKLCAWFETIYTKNGRDVERNQVECISLVLRRFDSRIDPGFDADSYR